MKIHLIKLYKCVQKRIDYGVMMSCLVKPALYIVQKLCPKQKLAEPPPTDEGTSTETPAHGEKKLCIF